MAGQNFVFASKIISLNKSQTKQICVGLNYYDKHFIPEIIIFGNTTKSGIKLNIREWKKLCNSFEIISNYFCEEKSPSFYKKFCGIKFENLDIVFSEFKETRCITLCHQDTRIVLQGTTVGSLKIVAPAVDYWLNYIQSLPIEQYKRLIVNTSATHIIDNLIKNTRDVPTMGLVMKYIQSEFEEIFKSCERATTLTAHLSDQGYSIFWELLYFHEDIINDIINEIENRQIQKSSFNYFQSTYAPCDDQDVPY